jgi:hypothetical protein
MSQILFCSIKVPFFLPFTPQLFIHSSKYGNKYGKISNAFVTFYSVVDGLILELIIWRLRAFSLMPTSFPFHGILFSSLLFSWLLYRSSS